MLCTPIKRHLEVKLSNSLHLEGESEKFTAPRGRHMRGESEEFTAPKGCHMRGESEEFTSRPAKQAQY